MKRLLFFILIIGFYACNYVSDAEREAQDTLFMPNFKLTMIDTTKKLETSAIPKGEPVVLFYFGTDCPHCQELTEQLTKRMDELKDSRIYFISGGTMPDIQDFTKRNHLSSFSNIVVARDVENYFLTNYKAPGYPYLVVYDKTKHWKETILGAVSVDSIKTVIHKT